MKSLESSDNNVSADLCTFPQDSSLRLLHVLAEQIQDGVLIEQDEKVVHLNKVLLELLALTPENIKQTAGNTIRQLVADSFKDGKVFLTRLHERQTNANAPQHVMLELKTGRYVSVRHIAVPEARGHIWIFKAEYNSQLRLPLSYANEFIETLLHGIPCDLAILTTEGRYLFINEHAVPDRDMRAWMLGKTDEEFCRKVNREEALIERRRQAIISVRETGVSCEWEDQRLDKNGEKEFLLRRLTLYTNARDNAKYLVAFGVNITQLKRMQAEQSRIEKRYFELFNYSQALICTHDRSGVLLSVNPAICKLMGYEPEELVNKNLCSFLPENHVPDFYKVYLGGLERDKFNRGVFCLLKKDGQRLYLLYQNYIVEEEGVEPYVIGFSQDITERIQAEKELVKAKELSEEAARAKESFLANMSHEIRTPMNGILGVTSLLSNTELNDAQKNFLKLIKDSSNNLLAIVNDVLDLEKILAGKLTIETIPFNLVDKVATTVQSFIYKAEEKGLAIIYQNNIPGSLIVNGDANRLMQVMNNLLSNAIKFTEKGHITITTSVLSMDDSKVEIQFHCKDTGIGISRQKIQQVFDPFVQADPAISRKYGGTGLGLSICKNLVDMQGGSLDVTSEEGVGSTFTVRLPYVISRQELVEGEKLEPSDFEKLGKRKVLVAEDVELNQFIARHIMEGWGFEVDIAADGSKAVALVEKNDYDLVLMDIQMPIMDGITATKNIRKLSDHSKSNIKIIAVTANALRGDEEKYRAAGMNDYLSKPFDEEKLFQVISRNLKEKTAVPKPQNMKPINAQSPTNDKLYDLAIIRSISGGDETFVTRMVVLFVETVPANLRDLNNALRDKNWDMVNKTAHKLKSTLDSMGIKSVKEDVRSVEFSAKKMENLDKIPAAVDRMNLIVNTCIEELQQFLKASNSDSENGN